MEKVDGSNPFTRSLKTAQAVFLVGFQYNTHMATWPSG